MTSVPVETPDSDCNPYAASAGDLKNKAFAEIPNFDGSSFRLFLFNYFLAHFFIATSTLSISWLLWKVLVRGQHFSLMLVTDELLKGLFFGLPHAGFLTRRAATSSKPKMVEIPPTKDLSAFLSDIERWLSKRQYVRKTHLQELIIYAPKTVIRLRYLLLFIIPSEAAVTIFGPDWLVSALQKHLEKDSGRT